MELKDAILRAFNLGSFIGYFIGNLICSGIVE